MARLHCTQCGNPLPRRATTCLACDAPVDATQQSNLPATSKSLTMRCAIVCVALSCLGFVITLGVTNLFQKGGLIFGGAFLGSILLSVRWVSSLEKKTLCRDENA
ncbi:hypothetical protein [uncultured Desulfuromonas sp.]|uniref:hypothetical protein n=1 Tax=uncultured Desulfuromonas sp. TaxID=181013 RepID=UPI002AAC2F7B|nr:hypothetical protein [uncultured Desulfuromonas sp.]